MKAKLITALRTAAKAVEMQTFYYDWSKIASCNCGSVVCALTGSSARQLAQRMTEYWNWKSGSQHTGTWTEIVGRNCPISGIPEGQIFQELFSAGLTPENMVQLENLSNPTVLNRLGVTSLNHKNPGDFARYARAWADLLVEEGKEDVHSDESAPPPNQKKPFFSRIFARADH